MIEQRAKVNNNNNNIMQALIQLPTKANNGHEVAQGMANTPLSLSAFSQPQTQSQLQFRGGNSAQHLKLMEIYSQTTHTHSAHTHTHTHGGHLYVCALKNNAKFRISRKIFALIYQKALGQNKKPEKRSEQHNKTNKKRR